MLLHKLNLLFGLLAVAAAIAPDEHPATEKGGCEDSEDGVCPVEGGFPNPIRNVFPCPVVVNAASICGTLGSNPYMSKNRQLVPRNTYVSSTPVSSDYKWVADTAASVVAIGSPTGCYNVYSDVQSGDELDAHCATSIMGDPVMALKTLLDGTSVVTAGNLMLAAYTQGKGVINGGIVVGGDLRVMSKPSGPHSITVAAAPAAGSGLFAGSALTVLGKMQPKASKLGSDLIAISEGDATLAEASDTEFLKFASGKAITKTEEEVESIKTKMRVLTCSATSQIAAAETTGTFSGNTTVEFVCDEGGDAASPCFIDVTNEDLKYATTFTLDTRSYSSAIVRVSGDKVTVHSMQTDTDEPRIMFAFLEATALSIIQTSAIKEHMPLFAPIAESLDVMIRNPTSPLIGPFFLGNEESKMMLTGVRSMSVRESSRWQLAPLGEKDVQIWICD